MKPIIQKTNPAAKVNVPKKHRKYADFFRFGVSQGYFQTRQKPAFILRAAAAAYQDGYQVGRTQRIQA
ncbi:MAG TPA: hypothetical protein VEF04_01875 [Blastocatellia bacterium]|nr:hypothetical protein [Blastocatellia bacterium]